MIVHNCVGTKCCVIVRNSLGCTLVGVLQAKVSELEQKVAEQQRAMTVLLQDKANLESRVNIFVRVLQMRDEQIEQIRSGQRVCLHAQPNT